MTLSKNFVNNWDLKSILTILIIVVQFVWLVATINAKQQDAIKQRDHDIETIQAVREADLKTINENLNEIKEMLREMRNDIKGKQDK